MYTHIEPLSEQVVFETQGEIDIRSFTTFGINVKPNTKSPIGYFGTGLKYAIAILTRNQSDRVRVLIGKIEYEFYCKKSSFRGHDFDFIKMRKRKSLLSRWRYIDLPFTTEFGKNWEMWQAFRELESNTRDEGGSTYSSNEEVLPEAGVTKIIISNEQFIDVFNNRNDIFLPIDKIQLINKDSYVEIYENESNYIYYRGLRVQHLEKPSLYTYNLISSTDLTEDRTLRYYHWELGQITNSIMKSTNQDFVKSIIEIDHEKYFEGELQFDTRSAYGSTTFMSMVGLNVNSGDGIMPRIKTLYKKQYPDTIEDPDVEITLKKSEWGLIYDVMTNVDLYEITNTLKWEEKDERLNPFIKLRDICCKNEESEDGIPL